jgi:Cof subfamily protein (haloacid dehalogenase superfamily)
MIKYIFCDLDGTLLYHTLPNEENAMIPNKNSKAINRLCKHDIKFVIATGRSDADINKVEGILQNSEYRISDNGAILKDSAGQTLFEEVFTIQEQEKIIDHFIEKQYASFVIDLSENNGYFSSNMPVEAKEAFVDQFNLTCNLVLKESIEDIRTTNNLKIGHFCIILDSPEMGEEVAQETRKFLGDDYNVYVASPRTIDISKKNSSKGNAIKKIMELENLKPEEIAVIGDGENDISMFELTPNSFAMSHASPDVKGKAIFECNSVSDAINTIIEMNGE